MNLYLKMFEEKSKISKILYSIYGLICTFIHYKKYYFVLARAQSNGICLPEGSPYFQVNYLNLLKQKGGYTKYMTPSSIINVDDDFGMDDNETPVDKKEEPGRAFLEVDEELFKEF